MNKNKYLNNLEDQFYKNTVEKTDFYTDFYTVERFSINKMTALSQCLKDMLVFGELSPELLDKAKDQLGYIQKILNTPNSIEMDFYLGTDDLMLYRVVPYGRTNYKGLQLEKPCGRMFPLVTSMASLSRQVRHYLFSRSNFDQDYLDVDLVNSHPSLIALYSKERNIESPRLIEYLTERTSVINSIVSSESCNKSEAKRLLLIALNTDSIFTNNPFVKEYHEEVRRIRELLWSDSFLDTVGTFISTNELRMSLSHRDNFKSNSEDKNKFLLQSYYCFEGESALLNKLRDSLVVRLNVNNRPNLSKDESWIHFIPFYDGAYIKTETSDRRRTLCSEVEMDLYIDEFNSSIHTELGVNFINFATKSIHVEDDELTIVIPDILTRYELLSDDFYKNIEIKFDGEELSTFIDTTKSVQKEIKDGTNEKFNSWVRKTINTQMAHNRREYFKSDKS